MSSNSILPILYSVCVTIATEIMLAICQSGFYTFHYLQISQNDNQFTNERTNRKVGPF